MSTDTTATPTTAVAKMSVPTLTAMVVGGMVGAGVFSLPARFGVATGILGSLIAWAIAGTGMLMLAFVFQSLAIRKPELDSGVFIYAKAGFGDYAGFNSAIGFWASSVAGNCFYWVFIGATLGAFFDSFGDGDTVLAVGVSTAGVWLFHYLIARGVRDAAVINRIVTVFKILPILVFIVVLFFNFDAGVFADNWTAYGYGDLGRPQRAGPQHDADHHVRLHRHRGRQRLLPLREAARGRRQGDRDGLPERAVDLRAGHPVELCGRAAARARRHPAAVDGRRLPVGWWGTGERSSSASR